MSFTALVREETRNSSFRTLCDFIAKLSLILALAVIFLSYMYLIGDILPPLFSELIYPAKDWNLCLFVNDLKPAVMEVILKCV